MKTALIVYAILLVPVAVIWVAEWVAEQRQNRKYR